MGGGGAAAFGSRKQAGVSAIPIRVVDFAISLPEDFHLVFASDPWLEFLLFAMPDENSPHGRNFEVAVLALEFPPLRSLSALELMRLLGCLLLHLLLLLPATSLK
eukprot:CAMPEP_0115398380 /NCGR_PEP_ID=MMETSP0271-20121206/14290_1 /TAXON_ID=71861 /ORGANISM="Scrippsiella trochoidea, Strain CCMP3099" /LENGTH=104 /DNA_ID=CAMNT_0002822157 /DNA_START=162 /DNA_END=476 /DNA_ORIENTATION=-